MRCFGKLVIFFILSVLVSFWGCYKPYQYEEYIAADGPSAGYMGQRIHEYQKYSAEGHVIMVAFSGESDGDPIFTQHGPYKVILAAWREPLGLDAPIVSIESLSVQVHNGPEYVVVSDNAPVVAT